MKPLVMAGSMAFCFFGCLAAAIWRGMDWISWAFVVTTGISFLTELVPAIKAAKPRNLPGGR